MATTVKKPLTKATGKKPVARKPAPKKEKVKKPKDDDPNKIGFLYAKGSIDVPMLVITLVLLIIGITMMFSASHALSYYETQGKDSYKYISSQLTNAGIGLVLMFGISFVDYRFYRKEFNLFKTGKTFNVATLCFWISLVFLAAVLPFGVSNIDNGPRRWLPLGSLSFQPSDLVKLGLIMYLSFHIWKNYKNMRYTKIGIIQPGIYLAVICGFMMLQPHLSGVIIMLIIALAMLFVGGSNMKTIIIAGIAAVVLVALLVMFSEFSYFFDRLAYTFDPLAAPGDKTYQSYQAILAVGSGGLWGVGFGNSTQKYSYLPEAQNDFVFAILCEEFGFVGGVLVILLFMIFVFRGFYIARKAHDRFGMMLATGISVQVGVQALLNVGVNVCCFPNTGISMPFFSYGGTALIIQLMEVGLLLSISRRSNLS